MRSSSGRGCPRWFRTRWLPLKASADSRSVFYRIWKQTATPRRPSSTDPRPTTPPRAYFGRTTVTHRFETQELRFSEDIYFFSNAGVIGLSIVCFIVLHCSSVLTATTESDHEEALRDKSPLVTVLDDGTIKQKFIPSTSGSAATTTEASNNNNGNRTSEKVPSETSGRQLVSGNLLKGRTTVKSAPGNTTACWKFGNWNKPKLFNLLLGITLWSSFLINGPLSSVYTYTCYSTGNHVFLVGAIFCDIFVLLSCVMSSRCTTRMDLSIVISFTCLGTIILTYFVALVVFTRGTHTRDYPIFGNIGEILTVRLDTTFADIWVPTKAVGGWCDTM